MYCFVVNFRELAVSRVQQSLRERGPQPRHSQGFISTGMLHVSDGFPNLTCKAWNGQILLFYFDSCMNVLQQRHRDDEEIHLAFLATRAMVCWFDRLARYGRYLNDFESRDIASYGFTFLRWYQKLAYMGTLRNSGRWKLLPKHHPFRHMQEDMVRHRYNYRYVHTFKDEDHIGILKKLALRVSKSDLMEFRVLTRFLLRLGSWQPN